MSDSRQVRRAAARKVAKKQAKADRKAETAVELAQHRERLKEARHLRKFELAEQREHRARRVKSHMEARRAG